MLQNIQESINNINENKLFIGLMVITVTIGGRFIIDEFSESQKKMINNKVVRRVFIFCVFFMATRDIITSFILTIIFALVMTSVDDDDDDDENKIRANKSNDEKKTELVRHKLAILQEGLNEIQKQL